MISHLLTLPMWQNVAGPEKLSEKEKQTFPSAEKGAESATQHFVHDLDAAAILRHGANGNANPLGQLVATHGA